MQIVNRQGQSIALGGPIEDAAFTLAREAVKNSVNKVEFLTAYSKPAAFTGEDLARLIPGAGGRGGASSMPTVPIQPGPPTLAERIKPTLVIDTKFGRKVIAPYGEAVPGEYERNIRSLLIKTLVVLAVYTAGVAFIGYRACRRSAGVK